VQLPVLNTGKRGNLRPKDLSRTDAFVLKVKDFGLGDLCFADQSTGTLSLARSKARDAC